MQNVISRKCDLCEERATSYSSGHGRWCDKHAPLPNFNPDLKGRREALIKRVADIIVIRACFDPPEALAEKILSELNL